MSDSVAGAAQPDPRPRPAYGEYATPEEQRARIAQPDVTAHFEAGQAPVAPAAGTRSVAPAAASGAAPGDPTNPAARVHPVDRIITIGLLAFGAVNVMFSAFSYFDLATVANNAMQVLGVDGEFTNTESAGLWGPIAAVTLVVGYLVAAVLSLRRLRAQKITWWMPLVGAVLTYLVVYICLTIPLASDPAFMQYVTSIS